MGHTGLPAPLTQPLKYPRANTLLTTDVPVTGQLPARQLAVPSGGS
jgi:hypothetical protein